MSSKEVHPLSSPSLGARAGRLEKVVGQRSLPTCSRQRKKSREINEPTPGKEGTLGRETGKELGVVA